jgi:hypothetical protein
MLLRREVMKLGSLFGLGAGTPSRFPYPDRPQPAPGVGPSSGQVTRARVVIVSGPTGTVSGVFVYAPGTIPGPGNTPIAAMTASATDPFGNDVQPGDASALGTIIAIGATPSGGTPSYVQLVPGTPQALLEIGSGDVAETAPLEVLTQIVTVGGTRVLASTFRAPRVAGENAGAFCSLVLESPTVDLTGDPQSSLVASDGTNTNSLVVFPTKYAMTNQPAIITGGTAAKPTLVTTDSAQAIISFSNGWTSTVARCALMPFGFGGKAMVYLELVLTAGTIADGTTMCALPAATYFPASTHDVSVMTKGGTALVNDSYVQVLSSGNIQCESLPTGTTSLRVSGFYPLD